MKSSSSGLNFGESFVGSSSWGSKYTFNLFGGTTFEISSPFTDQWELNSLLGRSKFVGIDRTVTCYKKWWK